jgi:hypothetical protein
MCVLTLAQLGCSTISAPFCSVCSRVLLLGCGHAGVTLIGRAIIMPGEIMVPGAGAANAVSSTTKRAEPQTPSKVPEVVPFLGVPKDLTNFEDL